MQVLVTGGTGVVGNGVIPELLAAGHHVRLMSRSASKQSSAWPETVTCINGDVTDPDSIRGAADDCDAVIHITGIVDEQPPEITFEKVNIAGTANIVAEAARAGVQRLIFVSSLGADRGDSPYHKSKLEAEKIVAGFPREWIIVRPGHVFGPGDEMISMVLKMVRTSPVVPAVGVGQHRFQPIWYQDFGKGLAACVDHPNLAGQTLDVAGDDVLTVADLLRKLSKLTHRPAVPIPLPAFLVRGAVAFYELGKRLLGWKTSLPLNDSKLTMLVEENVIPDGRDNALRKVLGVHPTPLDESLLKLCESLPENPPETGVGRLEHKSFWIDLDDASTDAAGLMTLFKDRIQDIMPIDFSAEPDAPRRIEHGETLSAHLPGRGNIQVRVLECEPDRVTFATIEGHPLAGMVTFTARQEAGRLRFSIDTHTRPANTLDWLAIHLAGRWFQDLTWKHVVEKTARLSGATFDGGVQHRAETLDDEAAKDVEARANELIHRRKRENVEQHVAANRS